MKLTLFLYFLLAETKNFSEIEPRSVLTSSLVVRFEATRYVWKPERPKIDQTEKKHMTSSTAVTVGSRGIKQKTLQSFKKRGRSLI